MRSSVGVTVGKFNPPHMGHLRLIRRAAEQVDVLYVLLGDRLDQTIHAQDRARWLEADAPANVEVIVTPDDIPEANEPWAERTLHVLPTAPDVAFTSEPWGPGWAEAMGASHVAVDPHRRWVPISATQLRADLPAHFGMLIPSARVDLVRRVVVAGAESTGKTTVARALADQMGTTWVPEYGRMYWEGRRYRRDQSWHGEEFTTIASTHHRMADDLARSADRGTLILDTDALTTNVWRERYVGESDPGLTALAMERRPSLYLVTAPDFEWVQDGTRESRRERSTMHAATLRLIERTGVPFRLLEGPPSDRLKDATAAIEAEITYPVYT